MRESKNDGGNKIKAYITNGSVAWEIPEEFASYFLNGIYNSPKGWNPIEIEEDRLDQHMKNFGYWKQSFNGSYNFIKSRKGNK